MKVSSTLIFAFFGLFASVLSLPSPKESKHSKDVTSIVTSLFATVQPLTGAINAATASLTPAATDAEKAVAAASVQSAISSLVEAITAATKQVHVVKSQDSEAGNAIQERQLNVNALAQAVTTLLMNISGALNNVISALGLTQALAFAQPLVLALSNLLLALEVVVNNLLQVVRQLVDGLLIGLSAALAGLVL